VTNLNVHTRYTNSARRTDLVPGVLSSGALSFLLEVTVFLFTQDPGSDYATYRFSRNNRRRAKETFGVPDQRAG
jgi:hypothetical protein